MQITGQQFQSYQHSLYAELSSERSGNAQAGPSRATPQNTEQHSRPQNSHYMDTVSLTHTTMMLDSSMHSTQHGTSVVQNASIQHTEMSISYSGTMSPEKIADKGYEILRRFVTDTLKEQGIDTSIATGSSTIDITQLSREEARELVAQDGYFGVEQTSDRIVDFALSLAQGDVTKLDAIKQGIEQGFNEALEIFGGALPQISHDTYDAALEKLDAWAAETKSGDTQLIG